MRMGSPWTPQEAGVHQICYLLAEVQKPGTNQGQVCGYVSLARNRGFCTGQQAARLLKDIVPGSLHLTAIVATPS